MEKGLEKWKSRYIREGAEGIEKTLKRLKLGSRPGFGFHQGRQLKAAYLVTERKQSVGVDKTPHPEKAPLKSLEFLEDNYKVLSRVVFSTQIAVDSMASHLLEKEAYTNVRDKYAKAFELYDVAKDEFTNKKQEGEDS